MAPRSEPDAGVLLRRIAASDKDAFADLYQAYGGRLLGFLCRLCGDPQAAEDLLQEVFLGIWRKAGSFDPARGSAPTWLFAVARNAAIDRRRRQRREPVSVTPADFDAWAGEAGDDGLRLGLEEAMATLSGDQRTAVRLAYFGGLTYAETAAKLEVPLGTLKSRIRSGLLRMRETLEMT